MLRVNTSGTRTVRGITGLALIVTLLTNSSVHKVPIATSASEGDVVEGGTSGTSSALGGIVGIADVTVSS